MGEQDCQCGVGDVKRANEMSFYRDFYFWPTEYELRPDVHVTGSGKAGLNILHLPSGLLPVGAQCLDRHAGLPRGTHAPIIVYAHDGSIGELRLQKREFCLEITFHIAVKVQVIALQISKRYDREMGTSNPVEAQSVRGDFQSSCGNMALAHECEEFL